jgi:hypothetical protein
MTEKVIEGVTGAAGPARLRLYLALGWMAGLGAYSFYLWGGSWRHGGWLRPWLQVMGEAVAGLPGLVAGRPGVLFGVVVLAAAYFCGRALLRQVLPEVPPAAMNVAAGLMLFSLVGLGLGTMGAYRRWPLVAMVLGLGGLGAVDLWGSTSLRHLRKLPANSISLAEAASLAVFGVILAVTALNPTVFYDALSYHLSLPAQYLLTGFTRPVWWQPYSYFPSNGELALGAAMAGGGPLAAQLLLAGSWLAAVLLTRALAARFTSPPGTGTGMATLVMLGMLTFALSAALVTIDLLVLLPALAGLYCLCGAEEAARFDPGRMPRWLMGWALFAAQAAGTKYTAWVLVLGPQALVAVWIGFTARPRRMDAAAAAVIVALALLAPWPLRNYFAAGNPLMPVPLPGLFRGLAGPAWQTMQGDAHRVGLGLASLPRLFASPWTMAFTGWDEQAMSWGVAGYIGPWLWMGAPLLLLWRGRVLMPRAVWAYAIMALALALALASFRMTRLAYPGLGAMAVLAGAGLEFVNHESRRRPLARVIFGLITAALVLLCLSLFMRATANLSAGYRFPRLDGDLPAYLAQRAETAPAESGSIPLQLRANGVLTPEAVVLFVGETRFLYLERPVVAPSYLVKNPLLETLREQGPDEAARTMAATGVGYVLIDFPELERLARQQPHLEITPELIGRVRAFSRGPCEPFLADPTADAVICRLKD